MMKMKSKNRTRRCLWVLLAVFLCIVAVVVICLFFGPEPDAHPTSSEQVESDELMGTDHPSRADVSETSLADNSLSEEVENNQTGAPELSMPESIYTAELSEELEILEVGSYTGVYMEDGTDDPVSGVLMILLRNNSDKTLEFAQINVTTTNGTGKFTASTVFPGATVLLLETSRMPFQSGDTVFSSALARATFFSYDLGLQSERLKVTASDGVITIENISGKDITGPIAVYYKNYSEGIYYGGITYRIVFPEGLTAGAQKAMPAVHYSEKGSQVVFITCPV